MKFIRRVWYASIWAPGGIPASESKLKSFKQIWLPIYDVALLWLGWAAVNSGVAAFETLLPPLVSMILGQSLMVVAALCFVGLAFPRLHMLEMMSKIALVALLATYFISLRILLNHEGGAGRDVVSIIVFLATIVPLYRLTILGDESRRRSEMRKIMNLLVGK